MSFRIAPLACAAALLAACSHGNDRPPPKPAPPPEEDASLYNEERPSSSSTQRAEETEAQLVAAQIRISTVIGQALRVGAAIWLTSQSKCPSADDIVAAHLVSDQLRSKDAWENAYKIECAPNGPIVTSAGPDGRFGTADDIVVGK